MKLKVKDMDIATGSILVVLLNQKDAQKLDLHALDRISIKKGTKKVIAIIDIAQSNKIVAPGKIGLFDEVVDVLKPNKNELVEIALARKPKSVDYILKKLQGHELTRKETNEIVKDIVNGALSEVELTYYVAASYTHGLSMKETTYLTQAMVAQGHKLRLNNEKIFDKHCSGGVPGNRTTMIVVPILAAAGLVIPKTSSRSITSPAGTADTMEVLAPVIISVKKIRQTVIKTKACIAWGGAIGLASADEELIKVRHPLSLDPEGLLLSSILAKKAAVGATHLLIDLPLGKDTKIKTIKHARRLKREFNNLGKKLHMKIKVIITNGSEPIGNGIGPALEARDVLWVLQGHEKRPKDLEKKSIYMASILLRMAGIKKAKKKAKDLLSSKLAYKKMKEIIKAQGGNPNIQPEQIKIGKFKFDFKAKKSGSVIDIDTNIIAKIARIAGAPKDSEAGIYLYKHQHQKVKKGKLLYTIYSDNKNKLKYAKEVLKQDSGFEIK